MCLNAHCGIQFLVTSSQISLPESDLCQDLVNYNFVDNKNLKGFQIVIGKMIQTPSTLSNQKPINFGEEEKR